MYEIQGSELRIYLSSEAPFFSYLNSLYSLLFDVANKNAKISARIPNPYPIMVYMYISGHSGLRNVRA